MRMVQCCEVLCFFARAQRATDFLQFGCAHAWDPSTASVQHIQLALKVMLCAHALCLDVQRL